MVLKIAIIDYEMGNLKSIDKLLHHLNVHSTITSNPNTILDADGVILPGVGAFGDAMKHLNEKNLVPVITQLVKDKIPLLGICLGLQMLYTEGFEHGTHKGLDIIPGSVIRFDTQKVNKIPQIGWNSVEIKDSNHFFVQNVPNNSYFYFVHSFYGKPSDESNILGTTTYGEIEFASIVQKDSVIATQFHPEKSGKMGISLYENFIKYCKK